ncbi:MAG TPA: hypothetical protein DCZ61_04955 [Lachnospiraceae bacterium]|nr:hypothetical protein [Lachnospiraceae bacterium]
MYFRKSVEFPAVCAHFVEKGGDAMIQESVKAVKDAEARAEAMIAEAKAKAAEIQKQAGARSEQILKDAEAAAKQEYDGKMAQARADGESRLAEADSEIRKEIDALKAAAAQKEEAAIERVIEKLW